MAEVNGDAPDVILFGGFVWLAIGTGLHFVAPEMYARGAWMFGAVLVFTQWVYLVYHDGVNERLRRLAKRV